MTNDKLKSIIFLLPMLLSVLGVGAQTIYFNYSNGTTSSYNLIDVRKITFDSALMNLHLWDGSLYTWNLSTIEYYLYDESTLSVQELLSDANALGVVLFPNPAISNLYAKFHLSMADDLSIKLYDLNGNLVSLKKLGIIDSGEHCISLDINGVLPGSYICQISGKKQTVIKQVVLN
jgi:hypothetical protein